MKILTLTTEYPPDEVYALGRWVEGLSQAMAASGHDVHVLTFRQPDDESMRQSQGLVTVHALPVNLPMRGHFWVANVIQQNVGLLAECVQALVESEDFDLVHAHGWQTVLAGKAVKETYGLPLVFSLHDCERVKANGDLAGDQAYIAEMEAWGAGHADVVLCDSHFLKQALVARYRAPHQKVQVVRPGVSPDEGEGATDVQLFRNQIFASPDEKLITFVGRLTQAKGPEVFVDAMLRILPVYPNARFAIAGRGPLAAPLRQRAQQTGVLPATTFTDYVTGEVLTCLYRASDVVVCPAFYEPSGMATLDAMLHKVPVVASATGALVEIVEPGRTGMLIPPGNPNALAQAVVRLLYLENEAGKMAENAHREVMLGHTWSRVAAEIANVYAKVTGKSEELPIGSKAAGDTEARVLSLADYRAEAEVAAE